MDRSRAASTTSGWTSSRTAALGCLGLQVASAAYCCLLNHHCRTEHVLGRIIQMDFGLYIEKNVACLQSVRITRMYTPMISICVYNEPHHTNALDALCCPSWRFFKIAPKHYKTHKPVSHQKTPKRRVMFQTKKTILGGALANRKNTYCSKAPSEIQ